MNAGCLYQVSVAAMVCSLCWNIQAEPEPEPLSPEQQVAVQNFRESLSALSQALVVCTPALNSVKDAETAAVAVPLVQQVSRAESLVKSAAEKVSASGVDVGRCAVVFHLFASI
jgi:hypothetical protein